MEKLKALPKWIQTVFLTFLIGGTVSALLYFIFKVDLNIFWRNAMFAVYVVAAYLIVYKPIKFKD